MKPVRRAIVWLEHRTGVETAVRSFLFDSIPASAGWPQVFGSIALFLFLTQAFTGILLAFNYAPTPGDAYNSLTYIMHEVTGGEMIRALHHWGASMMIVVVVIHMTQVFVFGAYKKPRETTWIVGVILLLLTLGFGLTGYLLPWDNRAYWGTTVTTKIVQQVPLIGGYLLRLMGAENGWRHYLCPVLWTACTDSARFDGSSGGNPHISGTTPRSHPCAARNEAEQKVLS